MPNFKGSEAESVLSGCRVLGVHRMEAVQRLRNLHTCCRVPDKHNYLHHHQLTCFQWVPKKTGGEWGIRTPDRTFGPITV